MSLSRSTRRLVRQGLLATLVAQVTAVATLMGADRVRRLMRGRRVPDLPPAVPVSHPIGDGSVATTYTYGDALFDDMLAAIAGAERRILLETYIIKGDETGRRFKQALIDAAHRGVDVYVIYDQFANLVVKRSFLTFPPVVNVLVYPVVSSWKLLSPRHVGRDHRKILVVDDKVAYVGGYNIGSAYATEWRDTHLRIDGPAVWDLDNAFVDFWNTHPRRNTPMIEQIPPTGWRPEIRAHRNVPRQLMYPIRGMYLEAIDRAHLTIDITAAYFIPDRDILAALLDARRRGVRVRIIVPRVSNHVVTDWLSRGFYGRLLRAGVEIHRYRDHMVHAKTATIDGEWTTIGTANIDRLSLLGNYEINLEILDRGLARGMQQVFADDCEKCEQLTLEQWMSRPLLARVYEAILRPLAPLL
ncbi:phospholipase D-like domain-containing protein [Aeromicrobium chenweiae]|uniref:Cardiolipin synthase B n=1 Tax=Aeromicrobium chenweiae TaxID=2079793 RepID=A0A2S0WN66_9ACTN|nr:phosphatidylserine/phosphatidylglycerophosphate/cardiolipin synthase family protein [Aeromicrobium chenweiae]AWB92757.1 cardiolipin synthase B [Aeromicrobium chenweiae]TGN33749.1 phosphatidylserine/phosphatidylglycerophosphate/cardiolipin synthase family protein [Aeromicrobium chenweiae]